MLFNSLEFLFFLPLVFACYWLLGSRYKAQNVLLLAASYFFYGYWDYRFLGLIVLSSAVDFILAKQIQLNSNEKQRKGLLALSLVFNLGVLAGFKYFDFFIDSANSLFNALGMPIQYELLQLIFPVGISFYTFQTLSYTIDVYRRKIEPTSDVIAFFGFVSFFPQLVAGPIERAADLLPQFNRQRAFNYNIGVQGLRQILWGMFKKVVLADNAAKIADQVFAHVEDASPIQLLLGVSMFFIQVYGDFSGYSDIAIGTARLFGFRLSVNFSTPFFSRSFSEFWRRWHITLNTWFRDYVYFPLGGSRNGRLRHLINISIVFVLCGFWHGAAWTFIFWGALNALYFVIEFLIFPRPKEQKSLSELKWPSIRAVLGMLIVFLGVALSLVFFRSADLDSALLYYSEMVDFSGKNDWSLFKKLDRSLLLVEMPLYLGITFFFEWKNRDLPHSLVHVARNKVVRFMIYTALLLLCIQYFYGDKPFVYFQF
jgi:D-alanyl-lipoteichoic acid acyltransferase DltB (MBOAT superfamily)